ncbi:MAG: hypothetical protein QOE73_2340 [Verrucomicrobiota bacterium]
MNNPQPTNGMKIRALLILVVMALSSCDYPVLFGLCKDKITYGSISPDGKYIAIVYQRDCGAPGGLATFVSIQPSVAKFEGRPKDAIFAVDGPVPVAVSWTDSSNLRIECIRCSPDKIFKQKTAWRNIAVSHESYGNH